MNKVVVEIISFMQDKLVKFKAALFYRNVTLYTILQNVAYVEDFFDKVLCVVTNNKLYKDYKVTSCKIANNPDVVSNRLYTVSITSKDNLCPIDVLIPFDFTLINFNTPLGWGAVINICLRALNAKLTQLNTQNLAPYLDY